MNQQMKSVGFVVACRDYFGQNAGQGLKEFQAEIKALSAADRAELTPMLERELGVTIRAAAGEVGMAG